MPIEGPLQELGLPDVFQLLDLSRKSGMLRVVCPARDDEGTVYFDDGRVVHAILRSRPATTLDAGAITHRELQRQSRARIENVVFELLRWDSGFFSFQEGKLPRLPAECVAAVTTESLLMESARRIDEWSRMAAVIPHVRVVPGLAHPPEGQETQLDLLPHEWEVLSLVDGVRDLRTIAATLHRPEFDTARILFGLVTTGVVEILAGAAGSGGATW